MLRISKAGAGKGIVTTLTVPTPPPAAVTAADTNKPQGVGPELLNTLPSARPGFLRSLSHSTSGNDVTVGVDHPLDTDTNAGSTPLDSATPADLSAVNQEGARPDAAANTNPAASLRA
jgi:hypothetical protein